MAAEGLQSNFGNVNGSVVTVFKDERAEFPENKFQFL